MEEAAALDDPVARIVAIGDAVDGREVARTLIDAEAGRADQAGGTGDEVDPLAGTGVGGEHVGLAGHARPGLHVGGAIERVEEPARTERIVAGPRQGLDTDPVRLELLIAGEPGQGEFRLVLQLGAGGRIVEHVGDDPAHQLRAQGQFGARRGMAQGDVGDFMRQHGGDLGCIAGQRQQPPGHVETAIGQGEGVDDRRVEKRDRVGLLRTVGGLHQTVGHLRQQAQSRRRTVFPPEGSHELGMVGIRRGPLPARGAGSLHRDLDRGRLQQGAGLVGAAACQKRAG